MATLEESIDIGCPVNMTQDDLRTYFLLRALGQYAARARASSGIPATTCCSTASSTSNRPPTAAPGSRKRLPTAARRGL